MFGESAPDVAITKAIEFARLADMCHITGMESLMAEHIKTIILANPAPKDSTFGMWRPPDTNTRCLTSQHITSAVALPEGHPERAILAAATVEGCLVQHNCRFEIEASTVPEFSVDLLKVVRATLESITIEYNEAKFEHPISQVRLRLKRTQACRHNRKEGHLITLHPIRTPYLLPTIEQQKPAEAVISELNHT